MAASMSPQLVAEAILVMDRVIKHPIASLFVNSPLSDDFVPGIQRRILDFVLIQDRLRDSHYKTVYAWLTDVEAVIHGVELSAPQFSFEALMAHEVRQLFNKERLIICTHSLHCWIASVPKLGQTMTSLTAHLPPRLKRTLRTNAKVERPNLGQIDPPSHQIQAMLNALSILTTPDDRKLIGNIIRTSAQHTMVRPGFALAVFSEEMLKHLQQQITCLLSKRGISYIE
jgi:hypothetical protein